MTYEGPQFYDDPSVFETYNRRRARTESPNEALERPVVREILGAVRGLHFLDLGCGDAAFGKELLTEGASSYLGIDGSVNMIAAAKRILEGTTGEVRHVNIQEWEYPPDSFDRVTARLSLHYLPELDPLFTWVHRTLRQQGRFIFSVEHPVITSCDQAWQGSGSRQAWLVDDYFDTGKRVTTWMGAQVIKYHRTVEDHFLALQRSKFSVESLRESRPERVHFATEEEFLRRKRIPLFLCMSARKL